MIKRELIECLSQDELLLVDGMTVAELVRRLGTAEVIGGLLIQACGIAQQAAAIALADSADRPESTERYL